MAGKYDVSQMKMKAAGPILKARKIEALSDTTASDYRVEREYEMGMGSAVAQTDSDGEVYREISLLSNSITDFEKMYTEVISKLNPVLGTAEIAESDMMKEYEIESMLGADIANQRRRIQTLGRGLSNLYRLIKL